MTHCRKRPLFRVLSLVLALVMLFPVNVLAAQPEGVSPRASAYLSSYAVGIAAAGNGKVEITFDVVAMDYMDTLGALSIGVYESTDRENWTYIRSYRHENYTNMIDTNDISHFSTIMHNGTAGRYYMAYVTIWAGKDGGGDSRYIWTPVAQAT